MSKIEDRLLERALQFQGRGHELYRGSRLGSTVHAFERARQLAAAAGDAGISAEDRARFWMGAALHGAGRLPEALAAWAPTVNRLADGSMTTERYMALTRYLLVAIDIPLPLSLIEEAFEQVEASLRASAGGNSGARSRVLLARARLAMSRGRWIEAVEVAQESLIRRRTEGRSYTYSTHYRTLIQACIRADLLELVPRYMEEWNRIDDCYPATQRLLRAAANASYARASGDAEAAFKALDPYELEIREWEDLTYRADLAEVFVRACIESGRLERAAPMMARAASDRRAPIGDIRYGTAVLLTDYHAAAAQAASDEDERARHVRRSARAAGLERREAARLDELLECRWRTEAHEGETTRDRPEGDGGS